MTIKSIKGFAGRLAAPIEVKATGSEKSGQFEGYASTRKLDSDRDIVQEGAFKRTIDHHAGKGLALLWFHDPTLPIGSLELVGEDAKGLIVQGEVDIDTSRGADVYSGMVKGYIDRMSIGYVAKKARWDAARKCRLLDEVALREVSMITRNFAANDEALVTDLKSASATIRAWADSYGAGQSVDVFLHEREVQELVDALSVLLGSDAFATANEVASSLDDGTKDSDGSRQAHPSEDGTGSALATLFRDTTKSIAHATGSPDEAKAAALLRDTFAALRG